MVFEHGSPSGFYLALDNFPSIEDVCHPIYLKPSLTNKLDISNKFFTMRKGRIYTYSWSILIVQSLLLWEEFPFILGRC